MLRRSFLLALSCAGVVLAVCALARGHGWLAGQILAGDVLVIFGVLMLV